MARGKQQRCEIITLRERMAEKLPLGVLRCRFCGTFCAGLSSKEVHEFFCPQKPELKKAKSAEV